MSKKEDSLVMDHLPSLSKEEEDLDETSIQSGTPTGAVAGYSGPVKKEDKLSPKQSKEMDTDGDGDIDAKDLKTLRLKEDGWDEPTRLTRRT